MMMKNNTPNTTTTRKQKIMVGLSGGVDSSVAVLLLLEQGYEVEGLFMKNWEEDDKNGQCASEQDLSDASKIAKQLGIKLHHINFSSEYWQEVFEDFITQHKKGNTPNPDVLCNEKIKFKFFLDYAIELGADKIATGHYANIEKLNDTYQLKTAKDTSKDQTYFLYRLNQRQLSLSLFPLGGLDKSFVRTLAIKNHLITANKKDSTGICFIGEKNFRLFLSNYIPIKPGNIIDQSGTIIKQHQGIAFYTIGQRKGLGIGGGFGASGEPWFVADKNIKNNELIVVQGNHPLLYHQQLTANHHHWINAMPVLPLNCQAKIRYRQTAQNCLISLKNKELVVVFEQKQRAITPGQSIVFYQQDVCLGGAVIKKPLSQSNAQ